ncbi:DUF2383 domain-containing protein [Pseudomaricurvus alcaniphilus]|uniref:DUF892 family protein n=1 Tax=Pseudomaricurvus alcaniphilus TaxID=1166482 RepID=UPI0014073DD0|nr:DUF892 family protein [Pseudomaricurvus alcaniphilus]NHN38437.1 DUF2383 domain-containing protein [Pseudomaricurvus alcaniphilus]
MFVSDEKIDYSFLIDDLNDLLQWHLDVIEGYNSAEEKARSDELKENIQRWRDENRDEIAALGKLIESYGGTPRSKPDLSALTNRLRVAVTQVFRDAGLVDALLKNESKLLLEYERSLKSLAELPGMSEQIEANYQTVQTRVEQLTELDKAG